MGTNHKYYEDDAWVKITQFQRSVNNYMSTMMNDLTECFPFTMQDEGQAIEKLMHRIEETITERRKRHEHMLDYAWHKNPDNERLTGEPGTAAEIKTIKPYEVR